MDSNELRATFLEFFAAREHTVVPSASLIPIDPTLLLTNAGMVPFKPYMLGEEPPPYPRAVTVQKVARTTDIDVVGTTARHLTFFEMLGNFSLGDYFKEKAIPWAYELVTEALRFDPDRLWYTVHETDDEAEQIWIDVVGAAPERVQRRGNDNFWQMGIAGPCGPSSEIFYDKGPEFGPDGGPVVDEERFIEFWNLVFMQNVQDVPYHVIGDLPAKNIDTGAGLERVALLLQGVDTVFHTDVVRPVIAAAEAATGVSFGDRGGSDVSLRILGDHGRSLTFLIADGVVPSNEGRGYVLRRLMRRAVRHGFLLGAEGHILPRLIDATVEVMGGAYPELISQRDRIVEMATREEAQFLRTLQSGHQLLDVEMEGLAAGSVFPGKTAFKLHDTYGFPVELTQEILTERNVELDRAGFDELMAEQRRRARESYRGGRAVETVDAYRSLLSGLGPSEFLGYESNTAGGRLLSIIREGEVVDRAEEGQEIEIFLDRTPFYAESGGQVGDSGWVETETGAARVADTQYVLPGLHGHRGVVARGFVQTGQDCDLVIDADRREQIRKNHTGTHILHWALRQVLGEHAHQAGSLVAPDRLRFDFSHFKAMDPDETMEVERTTNSRIIENALVETIETTKEDAERMGALAFFGDKYGEDVRVVKTGDYSIEFCGGTHVPSAGQVGPLILVSEGSVAANTRRVEALTGLSAYEHIVDLRAQIQNAETALRAQPGGLPAAASGAAKRLKEQERRIAEFEERSRTGAVADLLDRAEDHGDSRLVSAVVPDLNSAELRALAHQLRERLGSGVGVVGSERQGKAALVAFVSADLVDQGVDAGRIIGPAAEIVGGGGSRDPALAQAGGPRGDQVEEAVAAARARAEEALLAS